MFRTRIEEMEKEMAALRKNVGSNPAPKAALTQSTNARQRKEKIINCENVQVMEKLAETGTDRSQTSHTSLASHNLMCALGGSSASVFSCNVDGWNCAMKEMDLSGMHGDSTSHGCSFDCI